MCNFRKTEEKYDCTYCKHFRSYQFVYEDDLEPAEYGICTNVDDMVGEEMICDLFQSKQSPTEDDVINAIKKQLNDNGFITN